MDKTLPRLLEKHISSLLEEYSVSNWDLKCGQHNILTIHWKPNNTDSPSGNLANMQSHSIYRKKPPSQMRRDQRRRNNWRTITPDSGYTNCTVNKNIQNSDKSDNVAGEECPSLSLGIISKGEDNVNNISMASHEQSPVNTPVCELNFDSTPQEQIVTISPPLEETLHVANEMEIYYSPEILDTIPPLLEQKATPTLAEPTTDLYSNVLVQNIREMSHPMPKKYINVNCVGNDNNIDVSTLFYCKKCHVDLKQYLSDCPLNYNLCNECCILDNPYCPSCSYIDDT